MIIVYSGPAGVTRAFVYFFTDSTDCQSKDYAKKRRRKGGGLDHYRLYFRRTSTFLSGRIRPLQGKLDITMFAFAEIFITMGDIFGYDFPEIVVSGLQSSN